MNRVQGKRAALFLFGKSLSTLTLFLVFASFVGFVQPASSAVRIEYSPDYAVYVRLAYTSPFVPDGRSTFAAFEMESVFRKVVFIRTPSPVTGSPDSNFYISVVGRKALGRVVRGKGEISNFTLNLVDDGCGAKSAQVTEGPNPFEVTLGIFEGSIGDIPVEPEENPNDPLDRGDRMRLAFRTSFGLHTLRWDYPRGHSYLGDEAVGLQLSWKYLMAGHDFKFELPYQGVDPEEKGTWEFRFVPESSLK